MAFGPIMRMYVSDIHIELAPVTKESLAAFVTPGMQQASVIRYLEVSSAPTIEDEEEWYETTRKAKDSLVWGIWDITTDRTLIGTTSLFNIEQSPLAQATSGVMLSNKEYWGKGIASTIHKARTWYAFRQLGLVRIKSAVVHGNVASKKALQKSGYTDVYVERNTHFSDGVLHHQDNLECLNPDERAWQQWWGNDVPSVDSVQARQRTNESLVWAEQNVILL